MAIPKKTKKRPLSTTLKQQNPQNNRNQNDGAEKTTMLQQMICNIFSNSVYVTIFIIPTIAFTVYILLVHYRGTTSDDLDSTISFNNDINKKHNKLNRDDNSSQCKLMMSTSTIPNGGFGIFALQTIHENERLFYHGDISIQLIDILQDVHYDGISFLLQNYIWSSYVTNGDTEGSFVYSTLPGITMLANYHPTKYNTQFLPPIVSHEGGLASPSRQPKQHQNASYSYIVGSSTSYHNISSHALRTIQPGEEIFVDYGDAWLHKIPAQSPTTDEKDATSYQKSISDIQKNGICLDNLQPGISTNGKGHGAYATRRLEKGTIIAPLPCIAIHRSSLYNIEQPPINIRINDKQLLLNYVYSHPNSSILLFPYAPTVNYINHYEDIIPNNTTTNNKPNAVLRWSQRMMMSESNWLEMTPEHVINQHQSGILMELVALRDIEVNEEIVIDYGIDWKKAWKDHVHNLDKNILLYNKNGNNELYQYPHQVNATLMIVPTIYEEEERKNAENYDYYPKNVKTACYYVYEYAKAVYNYNNNYQQQSRSKKQWIYPKTKSGREMFERPVIHPCHILERYNNADNKDTNTIEYYYTVQMLDRNDWYDSMEDEDDRWIVTDVPRRAITFIDQVYTSDQNLPYAFRHEIGLPEGMFPTTWLDLK